MANDNATTFRGAGIISTFMAETGSDSLDDTGIGLIGWLDKKFIGTGQSVATGRRYKSWIVEYLASIGHPSEASVRNWSPTYGSGDAGSGASTELLGHPVQNALLDRTTSAPNVATSTIHARAEGLIKRFQSETGEKQIDADGSNLLAWLNALVTSKAVNEVSAKCYRRWLGQYLEAHDFDCANAIRNWYPPFSHESQLADDDADAASLVLNDLESTETNDRYYAYMGAESLKALLEQLVTTTESTQRPRYKNGDEIALFMVVTCMTGLRPMEWLTARYHDSYHDHDSKLTLGPVLEVKSLKQSGRRDDNPLKENRYLVLDEWPEIQLERLKVLMDIIGTVIDEGGEEGYRRYLKRNREQLRRAWDRLNKSTKVQVVTPADNTSVGASNGVDSKWVTFYTCRHIFSEEIRRSQQNTRFELAALLGHSLLTNQVYYGPRDKSQPRGFDWVLPRPWPGDAEDIQRWDYKVNPFRFTGKQQDMFGGEFAAADDYTRATEKKDTVQDFFAP